MTHYVYLTTIYSSIGEFYYIGKHSWKGSGIDPYYYGSGKILKNYLKKHGNTKVDCRILKEYTTEEESYEGEFFWTNLYDVENNPLFINLCSGGKGGNIKGLTGEKNYFYGKKHSKESIQKMRKSHSGKKQSKETREKNSLSKRCYYRVEFPDGNIQICHGSNEVAVAIGEPLNTHHIGEIISGKRSKNKYINYKIINLGKNIPSYTGD